jgi:hypothetical protein
MPDKTYRLKNGLELVGEPQLDGYIRGIELVRDKFGDDLKDEAAAEFSSWLDDAHTAKTGKQDEAAPSAEPAPAADTKAAA